ncbi:NAD(P)-dependent oxidoreductase [Histidinibacterium aquaticum]|uniref:SDR family oxidoreductase n=1 Tax=Histidinibacterium aquaticum TaxID=2613962 RepID=A0A5J5GD68_9RHOB|nr:NAD(P)-binding oxidoreductase [Histidinibacterium aquaticum]KAA9006011.1 SDR family oxidoreductase [Histidinibacterium aquaticum]
MKVCIIGISGKLGQYMVEHCLARGYEVTGVCRPESLGKLERFGDRITVFPGRTNDPQVVAQAVGDADGVLTVLAPWGTDDYASGTAKAVMAAAKPGARLIYSCGWHITRDGKDRFSLKIKLILALFGPIGRWTGLVDLRDQYRATDLIFESDTDWTVVRGSDLEEGESEGLPVWSEHVQDPILRSNKTRRIDFALFMVEALTDDGLIRKAPAINGCRTPSALEHGASRPAALRTSLA